MDRFDSTEFKRLCVAVEDLSENAVNAVGDTIHASVKDDLCMTLIECTQLLSLSILKAACYFDDKKELAKALDNVVEHTNALVHALHHNA